MKQRIVILGGGLAANFLAARIVQRGHKVTIIDDRSPKSASRVAAGMFKIITGRFGALSWKGPDLLKEIHDFFQLPELTSLQRHLHYTPIYRPFKTIEGYNKWLGRAEDRIFQSIVDFQEKPLFPQMLHNEFGGILIKPCGWADTVHLLQGFEHVLSQKFDLIYHFVELSYDQIDIKQQKIQLGKHELPFDHLIFAEGYRMIHNPWLEKVKIIPNKGEILLIKAPELKLPFAISKKVYLVHLGEGKYVCGSTYQNRFEDIEPSDGGKAEIISHLQKAIKVPFEVIDHWAGVRPTTPNRRPIVGTLPDYAHVHVLGGFGTKGMLLGPYTSRLLEQLIFEGVDEIPKEARLDRFF